MLSAIHVEGVSKQYRLGSRQSDTLAGLLGRIGGRVANWGAALLGRRPPVPAPAKQTTLWALKDVSFSVQPGEVVGIVGRNGNGKSTLLKILSRITIPTRGKIALRGSLASLLEVGTGFHPELTGRENIFLNGALMGMNREAIRKKLDEIVSFSEVETFLDTPVKRYSSGMYVRLAFAVAAHLEPDILLVDEVLAVGDGAFQKKCLGKIQGIGQSDRTVLFVSHSLPTVRSVCSRVILLDEGRVAMDGPTDEVLFTYNKMLQSPRKMTEEGIGWRLLYSNGNVRVSLLTAHDEWGTETWSFKQGKDVRIRMEYEAFESVPNLGILLALTSLQSGEVVTSIKQCVTDAPIAKGTRGGIEILLPKIPLRAGEYSFTLSLGDAELDKKYDHLDQNQSLPWLSISTDDRDATRLGGYFCIPAEVTATQ